MKNLIQEKLREIERQENCQILLAVESGSRAWGFASPDSDYDVRFIYARPKEFYLKLEKTRDVIELAINDLLDINGWDIRKALCLLHNSNPTVFEWFSSPILYQSSPYAEALKPVIARYFSKKSSLWHYLHMAENNYQSYLRDDMVKAKKYFYALRPLLACRWILERETPPPMPFCELMESQLESDWKPTVHQLLELKIHSPEVKLIPRIDRFNAYLEKNMLEIRARTEQLPKENARGWEELDALFLAALNL